MDQLALDDFDIVSVGERVGVLLFVRCRTELNVHTLGRLFEPLQLAQCGLDSLSQDGVHSEVFVEISLPGEPRALKNQEISVVGNLSADGPNLLRVEEFCQRPFLLLLLFIVGRVASSENVCLKKLIRKVVKRHEKRLGISPQGTPHPGVIDPGKEFKRHGVLCHVHVVHLRQIVLEDAPLQPDPLLTFESSLFFDHT